MKRTDRRVISDNIKMLSRLVIDIMKISQSVRDQENILIFLVDIGGKGNKRKPL